MKSRFLGPLALLRLLALATLLLALTPLGTALFPRDAQYVLILDESPSMAGRYPGLAERLRAIWNEPASPDGPVLSTVGEDGRDLSAVLTAALSLFEGEGEKRILLASDGILPGGNFEHAVATLRRRGARVYPLTPPGAAPMAGVVDIVAPQRVWLAEPFKITVHLAGTEPGPVNVSLERNGVALARAEGQIDRRGRGMVEFIQQVDTVGEAVFTLAVDGQAYPPFVSIVEVARPVRTHFVGADPKSAENLLSLLRRTGIILDVSRPADLAYRSRPFDSVDVIILDDPSPASYSEHELRMIDEAVRRDGKGLLVIGGRKGIGSEDFRSFALEEMLPVISGYQSPPAPEPVAMVIAMDTSFSMFFRGRGKRAFYGDEPRKIDVAKNSAREVIRALRPEDSLGIIGNSTDLFWIKELGPVTDRFEAEERVSKVFADGDGLNFYSIVLEAYRKLQREATPVRHILVFGDADDIDQYEVLGEGHSFDLVRQLTREGITLSVVAIGQPTDKDISFLRTATLLGQGDFYLVSNLRTLPQYFVSEYRKLKSRHFLEEVIRPLPADYASFLHGVGTNFPAVDGIALVTPREGSLVPVRTDVGAPLVTLGRYGSGNTAVFASDNGYRWAGSWTSWKSAGRFWTQLLFSLSREGRDDDAHSSLVADRVKELLLFRSRGSGGSLPPWERLWLHERGIEGSPRVLERVGLDEYAAAGPIPETGQHTFRITAGDTEEEALETRRLFVPPPAEDLPFRGNWSLLERLRKATGGEWVADAAAIVPQRAGPSADSSAFLVFCIAAGLTILLVETTMRQYFRR